MELVVLIALGTVVGAVAIDAFRRRPKPEPPREHDPTLTTSQRIIVDLTKRH